MGSEPRPSRSTFARRPLLKRESWRRRAGRPVRTRAPSGAHERGTAREFSFRARRGPAAERRRASRRHRGSSGAASAPKSRNWNSQFPVRRRGDHGVRGHRQEEAGRRPRGRRHRQSPPRLRRARAQQRAVRGALPDRLRRVARVLPRGEGLRGGPDERAERMHRDRHTSKERHRVQGLGQESPRAIPGVQRAVQQVHSPPRGAIRARDGPRHGPRGDRPHRRRRQKRARRPVDEPGRDPGPRPVRTRERFLRRAGRRGRKPAAAAPVLPVRGGLHGERGFINAAESRYHARKRADPDSPTSPMLDRLEMLLSSSPVDGPDSPIERLQRTLDEKDPEPPRGTAAARRGAGDGAAAVRGRGVRRDGRAVAAAAADDDDRWRRAGRGRRARGGDGDVAERLCRRRRAKRVHPRRAGEPRPGAVPSHTPVPVRPRRRGERDRFLKDFISRRISPPRVPRSQSRRTSTPFNSASDAFELLPDVASYGTALRWTSATRTSPWSFTDDASARTSPGSRISC